MISHGEHVHRAFRNWYNAEAVENRYRQSLNYSHIFKRVGEKMEYTNLTPLPNMPNLRPKQLCCDLITFSWLRWYSQRLINALCYELTISWSEHAYNMYYGTFYMTTVYMLRHRRSNSQKVSHSFLLRDPRDSCHLL